MTGLIIEVSVDIYIVVYQAIDIHHLKSHGRKMYIHRPTSNDGQWHLFHSVSIEICEKI